MFDLDKVSPKQMFEGAGTHEGDREGHRLLPGRKRAKGLKVTSYHEPQRGQTGNYKLYHNSKSMFPKVIWEPLLDVASRLIQQTMLAELQTCKVRIPHIEQYKLRSLRIWPWNR